MLTPVFQLVPTPLGQPAGGLNCGAAVTAMLVDHATGGKYKPTAAAVRALCRNPDGTPDRTGGTHLRQHADAAWRGWQVSIDIETPIAFEEFWKRLVDPAIVASVSVSYGAFKSTPAYASRSGFVGNHQVLTRRKGIAAEMFDPLADGRGGVPRAPVIVTKAQLRAAAGALVVNHHLGKRLGAGYAYVGFARAPKATPPKPTKHSVKFSDKAFWVYGVQADVAISRASRRFTKATSAPAEAPRRIPFGGVPRMLAKVTAGALMDRFVEPGRSGVVLVAT